MDIDAALKLHASTPFPFILVIVREYLRGELQGKRVESSQGWKSAVEAEGWVEAVNGKSSRPGAMFRVVEWEVVAKGARFGSLRTTIPGLAAAPRFAPRPSAPSTSDKSPTRPDVVADKVPTTPGILRGAVTEPGVPQAMVQAEREAVSRAQNGKEVVAHQYSGDGRKEGDAAYALTVDGGVVGHIHKMRGLSGYVAVRNGVVVGKGKTFGEAMKKLGA
jgi:hypothetical protein